VINFSKIPNHVAIIMDGNGRWAKERGFERYIGHKLGIESVREIIGISKKIGIKYLTLYVFSKENWKRPKEEIKFLFNLLKKTLEEELERLKRNNIRVLVMGKIQELKDSVKNFLEKCVNETKNCDGMNVIIAFNYSGREEIIDAVNKILKEKKNINSEKEFSEYLYLKDVPEPDLLIRTSGEMRISNFMLWQIAYTELFFTKKLWPDFRKKDFIEAIEDFSKRERRFGGIEGI